MMRPMNKTNVIRCLLLAIVLSPGACKPPNGSSLSAIVSQDGMRATGLLPIRQKFEFGVDLPDGEAVMVEDAMRLTYGAAECTGSKSALVFNFLEDVTRYSVLGLKREGREILIPVRSFDETIRYGNNASYFAGVVDELAPAGSQYKKVKSCSLKGESTLSAGSFVSLMTDPEVDFETKQIIWLAARGRATDSAKFSKSFYTFLRENLGATPIGSSKAAAKTIAGIDAQFNPCVSRDARVTKNFTCDENKNYRVTGSYAAILDRFLAAVATENEGFLKVLADYGPQGALSSRGLKVAASAGMSIVKSGLLGSVPGRDSKAPTPAAGIEKKLHPMIAVMLPRLHEVQQYFHVAVGTKPGSVLDPENPAPVPAARASSKSGFGLAGDGADDEVGFGLLEGEVPATEQPAAQSTQGTTPATLPTQAQETPLVVSAVTPATNLTGQGDEKYWSRGENNTFSHVNEDGTRWESKAVQGAGGVWSYQNTLYKDNQPQAQKVLFRNPSELVGGAATNTFVSYDVKPGATNNWQDRSQYQSQAGQILTTEGGQAKWLSFESAKEAGSAALDGTTPVQLPSNSIRNGVLTTMDVKPYKFTSGSDVRYLASAPNGGTGMQWLTPKSSVEEVDFTYEQVNGTNDIQPAKTENKPTVVAKVEPAAAAAIRKAEGEQEIQKVQEQRDLAAWNPLDAINDTYSSTKKKLLDEYDRLQAIKTEKAALDAKAALTKEEEARVRELEAAEAEKRVAVARAQQEDYARTNMPKSGERYSQPDREVLNKKNDVVLAEQKAAEVAVDPKAKEAEKIQADLLVEQERLQAARTERSAFQARNGNRYTEATMTERWNPFGSAYDINGSKSYDRYSKAQVAELESLHRRVAASEQNILEMQRRLAVANGTQTARAIPVKSRAGN